MKKRICFYVVLFFCTCITFLLDHYINVGISLRDSNIISVALSFLAIVFSLWFSYLLVIKQIYSNRYSNRVVNKYVYAGRKALTIHFFVLLFIGFFLLIFADHYVLTSLWFVFNCALFVFLCGKNIHKKLSEEEIRTAIKDKINYILTEISSDTDVENVKEELKKLKNIYDDAYLKSEISTCISVQNGYYEFFKKYIENRNKNIIDDDKKTKEILNLLIKFHRDLLKNDNLSFAVELNRNVLDIFYKLADISIKCSIETLLVSFLNSFISVLSLDSQKLDEWLEYVYHYIYKLELKAMEYNNETFFDKILERSKAIYFSKYGIGKGTYIAFFKHYVNCILYCLNNNKDKYYEKIYEEFESIVLTEISVDNCDNICVLLSLLLNNGAFKKSDIAKKDLLGLLKSLSRNKTIYDNRFFSFIGYAVDQYKKNNETESAFELQYLYAKSIVENMTDAPSYIFPEFSDKVGTGDEKTNKILSDKLDYLLAVAIDKNETNWVGLLLTEVIECLKHTEQKDKDIQLIWIQVLQKAAVRVSSINNALMQEIVIRYYRKAIFKMDDQRIISKGLGVNLIDNLRSLCEYRYRENVDFTCEIVELLNDLLDSQSNLYFINNNKDTREKVHDSLFNIAIDSIEKNQDLVIKRVSNIIGWRIKGEIECGRAECANKLLEDAIKMYNLCRANKISDQTIVFIGTLFIIIGAYAGTEPKYYGYRNRIITSLRSDPKNKEYLEVSKQLRQCETLGWTHLLGSNPNGEINKFWIEYNK